MKWIDDGLLKSWKLPGSNARRVYWDDMIAFANEHGLRLGSATKIMYVEPREDLIYPRVVVAFLNMLGLKTEMVYAEVGSENFNLGALSPSAVILNLDGVDAGHLDTFVKNCKDRNIPVLGVTKDLTGGQASRLEKSGIHVLRI